MLNICLSFPGGKKSLLTSIDHFRVYLFKEPTVQQLRVGGGWLFSFLLISKMCENPPLGLGTAVKKSILVPLGRLASSSKVLSMAKSRASSLSSVNLVAKISLSPMVTYNKKTIDMGYSVFPMDIVI
jgi:hypothetical protein